MYEVLKNSHKPCVILSPKCFKLESPLLEKRENKVVENLIFAMMQLLKILSQGHDNVSLGMWAVPPLERIMVP